jgi:hypothetical protein
VIMQSWLLLQRLRKGCIKKGQQGNSVPEIIIIIIIIILIININSLALELDIYSLAHHLCKTWIFYAPRRVTLGNTHFVEEQTEMAKESLKI